MKINVKCPPCIVCGRHGTVQVQEDDFYKWQGSWDKPPMLAQEAFPYLTLNDREMLISGTHPNCWDTFINDVEDEANGEGQRV
jgi:hypothetical protein